MYLQAAVQKMYLQAAVEKCTTMSVQVNILAPPIYKYLQLYRSISKHILVYLFTRFTINLKV